MATDCEMNWIDGNIWIGLLQQSRQYMCNEAKMHSHLLTRFVCVSKVFQKRLRHIQTSPNFGRSKRKKKRKKKKERKTKQNQVFRKLKYSLICIYSNAKGAKFRNSDVYQRVRANEKLASDKNESAKSVWHWQGHRIKRLDRHGKEDLRFALIWNDGKVHKCRAVWWLRKTNKVSNESELNIYERAGTKEEKIGQVQRNAKSEKKMKK